MSSNDTKPRHMEQESLSKMDEGLLIALASWLSTAEFDHNLGLCTDKEFIKQCNYLRQMDLTSKVIVS